MTHNYNPNKEDNNLDDIRELVNDCIFTNNIEILVHLIHRLQHEYVEIARLATMDEYKKHWTHHEVLNHITYEM